LSDRYISLTIDRASMAARGRIGGYATAARNDSRELTQPARQAFEERFYEGIPLELPVEERDRRARAARREYFARLAFASVQSRSKKKAAAPASGATAREGDRDVTTIAPTRED
jgi:hypothetical protein